MCLNNLPKVATQWNSGATRDSNRGHRARIPGALTTRPMSHKTSKNPLHVLRAIAYYAYDDVHDCCVPDGADVVYNKFNVDSSSPPDNPPQHPNSDYSCVVATTGQWRVSRCTEQHRVVCQSVTLTGISTTYKYRHCITYLFIQIVLCTIFFN